MCCTAAKQYCTVWHYLLCSLLTWDSYRCDFPSRALFAWLRCFIILNRLFPRPLIGTLCSALGSANGTTRRMPPPIPARANSHSPASGERSYPYPRQFTPDISAVVTVPQQPAPYRPSDPSVYYEDVRDEEKWSCKSCTYLNHPLIQVHPSHYTRVPHVAWGLTTALALLPDVKTNVGKNAPSFHLTKITKKQPRTKAT